MDWLSQYYTPIAGSEQLGMNLITANYPEQNQHLFDIKFAKLTQVVDTDSSGKNIIFTYQLDGNDVLFPVIISLDEYYKRRLYSGLRTKVREMAIKNTKQVVDKKGGKIELVGADIAGQRVSLNVSGNININGRLQNQERSQVASGYQEGKSTTFLIDQKQQLSIEGKIGDRVSLLVDQDSERTFDFENNMRIHYTGKEDEIIQKVDAGNISLSLPGTQYVTFSSKNSGLFGVKTELKLGPIDITAIASVEKGEKQKLSYDGGSQKTEHKIKDYEYRKNLYFFLDHTYRNDFYKGYHETGIITGDPSRVVKNLEVYKSIGTQEVTGALRGVAYVNPQDTLFESDRTFETLYKRLEENRDYEYSAIKGWIRLKTGVQQSEVLAVVYRTTTVDANNNPISTVEEFGDWDRDPADSSKIALKLIKPQSNLPEHPCWDLMWRNVYYLGTEGINKEGFELTIEYVDGKSGNEDRDKTDGKTFLEKFGLDKKNENGEFTPDDYIDLDDPWIINLQRGELWLPYVHPFEYNNSDDGIGNPNISDDYDCSKMYYNSDTKRSEIIGDSKFEIVYKYENRSSILNLGPMIIEGSEEVTLNGNKLMKGTDYTIDYMMGTLNILRDGATSPDAKLDVKFEKNQFFQLKKKTILGARAQYDFGDNNFLGATALYYSKSVVDDKVDVGYEPMRNFVLDINGRYNKDLDFLTKALDRLPLIDTDAKSSFSIEGEIARVSPNPNTINNPETGDLNGVAFIDDFEGVKRVTSPPMMRRYWSRSTPPLSKEHRTFYGENELRGYTYWFNPYRGVTTKEIWPNKSVSTKSQNNTTDVLTFVMEPAWACGVGNSATDAVKEQAWGGITYFFPSSYRDQSRAKFIEITLRGDVGILHVDLGQISEDQIPDGKLNTEDIPEAGLFFGNGLMDKGEDTGIDGLFDEDEVVYARLSDGTIDTLRYGDPRLKSEYNRSSANDPHEDNWKWENGSSDFRHINGTEKSEKDVTGTIPDTENLNDNPSLDDINSYASVELDLSDFENKYIADAKNKYGWKKYQIPMTEFMPYFDDEGNEATFSREDIHAMRLWFDGVAEPMVVSFAKVEITGNEWQEMGISEGRDTSDFVKNDEVFAITTVNTEEHTYYEAPEGVNGEWDKINEIRRKEQSLVLKIFDDIDKDGLKSGEIASAEKDLLEELSLITYKQIKMYLSGYEISTKSHGYYSEGHKTPLTFFLKLGRAGSNPQYYEYRQPIYIGWDDRNEMKIDIDFMTSLKAYAKEEDFPENAEGLQRFFIFHDDETGTITRREYHEVIDNEYTGRQIIIHNEPAISRIKRLEIGLINDGTEPVFGEVWLDELRLSDVRKNSGIAYRSAIKFNLADFASINLNVSKKGADFHTVEKSPSMTTESLTTTEMISANGKLSLHKLLPAKWGVSLPVSAKYSESKSTPKYVPGSDFLAGDHPADSIMSISHSYGINTSFTKSRSDFWLFKYTLDQIKISFHAGWKESSNRTIAKNSTQTYSGSFGYQVPFGRDNYFNVFKWAEKVPVFGKKMAEIKLYYLPNKFSYDLSAAEKISDNEPRIGERKFSHTLGWNQNLNFGYKATENMDFTYSRKVKNNMSGLFVIDTVLNNKVKDKFQAISEGDFGIVENVDETYNISFKPQIFSWLNPNLTYNGQFRWSEQANSQTPSIDALSNKKQFSGSVGLNLADIFKSLYAPGSVSSKKSGGRSTGRNSRSSRSNRGKPKTTTPDKKDKKEKKDHKILDGIHGIFKKVKTIQVSYQTNTSTANAGRLAYKYDEDGYRIGDPLFPGLKYRMGFDDNPHIEIDTVNSMPGRDNISTNMTLSLRTGLDIFKNISTDFSFGSTKAVTMAQGSKNTNISRDYLPLGDTGKDGIPIPGWTVRINSLEKLPLMEKIFSSFSLNHGFQGKETTIFKDTVEQSSSYRMFFQPLIGVNMKFKNNMASTFRMSKGNSITNNQNSVGITSEQSLSASFDYKMKGGITIPLPFMENKRLDNSMTIKMTFDYSTSESRQRNNTGGNTKFATMDKTTNWKISPRIDYSFTKKVTGGIFFMYGINDSKRIGKRTTKNGGFDINIAIRG